MPLSPADVGNRVVVRRRLDDGTLSDVLGDLVEWSDGWLTVRRRDGTEVGVPHASVVAGKRIPPPPARRSSHSAIGVLELEEVAALGWRALESSWLGRWLLRASEGWTGRGNSVLPLGEPGLPLDEALAQVRAWYAARDLPARFQVPLPARADLDAALAERGWPAYNATDVMTAALPALLDRLVVRADLPPVEVTGRPDAAWLAAYHYRGGPLPAVAPRLLTSARRQAFATVREGEQVIAVGRCAVDAGWAGLTGMEVDPSARRRGLGGHVLRALCAWAMKQGAGSLYLQVDAANTAARALYERAGLCEHHTYVYRVAP